MVEAKEVVSERLLAVSLQIKFQSARRHPHRLSREPSRSRALDRLHCPAQVPA